jgi:hypothetical protein
MVTHDRALLERICDRLVLFEALPADEAGKASYRAAFFRGGYRDYLRYGWGEHDAEKAEIPARAQPRGTSAAAAIVVEGLPDTEALAELARQSRTSPAGYCSKQIDRLRRRMDELEKMIEGLEQQIGEHTAEQRERDSAGDYSAITRIQMEIDALSSALDRVFDELAEAESDCQKWEQLGASLA